MKKLESFLKRLLLRILLFLKKKRHVSLNPEFNSGSRILFVRLNRIGDALVTTPLIKLVKENINCRIDILADTKNSFIFSNNPYIDNVLIYNKGLAGFKAIINTIKSTGYDAVVDLHDDISTTVSFILAFSDCRNIFGLSKGNDHLYTATVPRSDPQRTHVVDRLLALSELFGIKPSRDTNIVYCVNEKLMAKVHNTVKKKFPGRKFLLGINISAGSDARYWGTAKFIQLMDYLSKLDVTTLFLCSTRDINLALAITNNQENIFYSPSFEEFSAMIAQLDMLFTPDTSVIHIASVFNIPVFGMYVKYKTNDMVWSPYKSDFEYIVTEDPTLSNITFKEVTEKFIPFLAKYNKK